MDERQLLKHFNAEAEELVETLLADVDLLGRAIENGRPNPALVNGIFRTAHTLKGLAGMANVPSVHRAAHAFEDVLEEVRMGRLRLDRSLVDGIGRVADELGALVRAVASGVSADRAADRVIGELAGFRGASAPELEDAANDLVAIDPKVLATLTEYEEHRLRENIRERRPLYELRVAFDLVSFDQGFRSLNERLAAESEIIGTLPGVSADDPMKIAFRIVFASDATVEALAGLVVEPGGELELLSRYPADEAAPIDTAVPMASSSIRVDMGVFDELARLADDLATQVAGLGATCASMARHLSLSPREQFELRQQQRSIERAFGQWQERLVDARLVPLGPTLVRARRLVDKLAAQLGRSVEFDSQGEDVRLDKTIVDRLAEPLAHLLGNAVDHGIEPALERTAAGKAPAGSIRIAAESSGNRIALTVADDGRGIDGEAVRLAAEARGVVTTAAGSRRPLDMIFSPGVSTAAGVSGISGRGVGLDAVAAVVAELGGEIRVETELGKGTIFTLELPTTLVVLSAFLVEAGGWTYAVDVNQLVELGLVETESHDGRRRVRWRDGELDYHELVDLVRAGGDPWRREGRVPCLIARNGSSQAVIAVDRFLGERDVIVKSLGRYAPALRGVSGAIDLEDDRIALLIDLPSLIGEEALAAR